jgi:hypothetical protein
VHLSACRRSSVHLSCAELFSVALNLDPGLDPGCVDTKSPPDGVAVRWRVLNRRPPGPPDDKSYSEALLGSTASIAVPLSCDDSRQ